VERSLSGVAEYTTSMACRYAADAQKAGCDGLMVLPAMVYFDCPKFDPIQASGLLIE